MYLVQIGFEIGVDDTFEKDAVVLCEYSCDVTLSRDETE